MAIGQLLNFINRPFSVRSNITANIIANAAIAAIFFISVPLFVKYIGIEGYGLIGFFIFAQGVISVLDLGLNVVLTREFAAYRSDNEQSATLGDLLRTSEIFYWTAGIGVGLLWAGGAGFLSRYVNSQALGEAAVYHSFVIMAGVIALQFPLSLYSAALFGLQRQATVSVIAVLFSLLRNLGVVAVLVYVAPTPQVFFGWQLLCWLIHIPLLTYVVKTSLPRSEATPKFRPELLTHKWKLLSEIGVITLSATLLMYVDKFVLARLISLEAFGYYALAAVVANGFHWLTQPVFRAMLPRLSQLAADGDRATLSLLYHKGGQVLSLIVFPIAGLWIFFSYELMSLWQRDTEVAANSYVFVILLVIGAALNGVALMPYALQIAFGKTRPQLAAVGTALLVSVPLTIVAALRWGGVGAATVGIVLSAGILAIVVPLMHRRLLKGEALRWLKNDIAYPAIAVVASGAICRYLFVSSSTVLELVQLTAATAVMIAAAVVSSSLARDWIRKRVSL